MEELCQPTMLGWGGPIAPMTMQATDFRLKNQMIQQVQQSCQYHGLPRDDANKHIDKFLTDTSAQRGESSRSITSSFPEIAVLTQQIAEMNKNFLRMSQSNQQVNFVNPSCETCGGPHHYSECQASSGFTEGDVYAATGNYNAGANQITKIEKAFNERPQGALPSNTIPNSREDVKLITIRSGITLAGPSVSLPNSSSSSSKEVERDSETIMDQVHISSLKSTVRVPSLIIQPALASKSNEIPKRNPHQRLIPYPSSFAKALAQMPKYTNKEKLLELANTPLNENCSAVLLKKLPEKLGDPGKFLIPCDFIEHEECLALADLAKDVFVQVGKFTFHANFVIVDYDIDPCVPFILWRPFLRTAHALVDVHGEELTLRVDKLINQIYIIDTTCEDHFHEVLNVQKSIHPLSGSPTPSSDHVVASLSPSLTPFKDSDFLLEETDAFISLDDSIL
ncbi:hypothetical protein Tco_0010725 [Tanacetum coccineum]